MELQIFGRRITYTKAPSNLSPARSAGGGGWWPYVREPYTGAWQQNDEIALSSVLAFSAVYSCVTLIAADIAKLPLRLVAQDSNGVWSPVNVAAFSPVLRKPNRYSTPQTFLQQWLVSKLTHGNTYVLKERDGRNGVRALYVLDPTKVTPLIAPDGGVYYQLKRDDLAQVSDDIKYLAIPASEIIHDVMVPLYHPLVGVTPIYASGVAASQGLAIQNTSTKFFGNGSNPGGVLTAPGSIKDETAARLKAYWDTNFAGDNVGKVAVLGDGLKYEAMHVNAHDAQLIEQLKYSVETVCSCYHVPAALIDSSHQPPYANAEPLVQQYFSQCLQSLVVGLETCLDGGLGLTEKIDGTQLGVELDIDDLLWMDTATRTKAATEAISGGALSPNEARHKYFGLGPVKGGNTPYLQQQNFGLAALADRDADKPFAKPAPPAPPPSADRDDDELADDEREVERFASALLTKVAELYA